MLRRSIFFACGLSLISGAQEAMPVLSESDISLPEVTQFEEIGSFKVTSAILVKLGLATEVPKGDIILRVFSDGIDIRISPEGQDEDFLAFQIYQTGGISDDGGKNLLPGVQAFSDQGQVIRHLVVNRKLLTITKFPTLTSDVEIIYAKRHEL